MGFKTELREFLIRKTGYWIYRHEFIPIGTSLFADLKLKMNIEPNIIFDVGANVGQTAIQFHKQFPKAKIISFEPVLGTFQKLKKNTAHISNIVCFNEALGSKNESINIRIHEEPWSVLNSLIPESMNNDVDAPTERIRVIEGDEFCVKNGISRIDLLKIDVEGYEMEVLRGFEKMISLSNIAALYCEVGFNPNNKRNTHFPELNQFAYQNGFSFYGMYDISNIHIKSGYNFGNALYINDKLLDIKLKT